MRGNLNSTTAPKKVVPLGCYFSLKGGIPNLQYAFLIMQSVAIHLRLIVLTFGVSVSAQGIAFNDGSSVCNTGDDCIEISQCKTALRQNLKNTQPTLCGWAGTTPKVCCKDATGTRVFLPSVDSCAPALTLPKVRGQGSNQDVVHQIRPLLASKVTQPTTLTQQPVTSLVKPLVVGGKNSDPGSRPWMAAIAEKGLGSAFNRFFCGASLIGLKHVLLAAHCFTGRVLDERQYEILFGSNNIDTTIVHDVEKITIHPEYIEPMWYNDIAIIRLINDISFGPGTRPICLPPPSAINIKFQSSVATVAGWGSIKFRGEHSQQLQEVDLSVVTNDKCNDIAMKVPGASRRYPQGITEDMICAGSQTEEKDACQGDSGGPLFLPDQATERWIIIGVVSTGFGCGTPGVPGLYTRTTSYREWIINNMI